MSIRVIALSACLVLIFTGLASAAPFVVVSDTNALIAPSPDSGAKDPLPAGSIVDVTHQAGDYYRVVYGPKSEAGYLSAKSVRQAKTKGGPLIPILIAAATPLGKMVAKKATAWFAKKFNINLGGDTGQVSSQMEAGQELVALDREDGWLKVKLPDGAVGYVKDTMDLASLQDIAYAQGSTMGIWKNSEKIPGQTQGLALRVELRKTDGAPVPPNSTLRLGDEYRIYITASADCYVRITAETPDKNHVCQYYPNHFPGTQTSMLFKAGKTYSGEMLPDGRSFLVARPIGAKDIIRIEATGAGPYHYVSKGDGCAPTATFKGGGFSVAGDVKNPTAQVLVEYPVLTTE